MNVDSLKDKVLGNRKKEDAGKPEKAEPMPWYAYRMQPISARALRREREQEIKRNTKKYQKQQRAERRSKLVTFEKNALQAVRNEEASRGLEPGTLARDQIASGVNTSGATIASVIQIYSEAAK